MNANILEPSWLPEDSQFLETSHLQIQDEGRNIGEIIISKFDWSLAASLNTHKKWIAKDSNILGKNEMYIFNKDIPTVSLTPSIGEFLSTKDPIILLKHFKVSQSYCALSVFSSAMHHMIDMFHGKSAVLFVPQWEKIKSHLNLSNDQAMTLFHTFGLIALDDHMLFRYMDDPLGISDDMLDNDETLESILSSYEIE